MTTYTLIDNRKSFSKEVPATQLAWDSVSLGAAKDCPRKYELSIVLGWRPKHESLHLRYGQLYHRVLEVYDHKTFEGMEHEAALRFALRDLAEGCMDGEGEARKWWNPEEHLSEAKAKTNAKTIPNLFRTAVWYIDKFGPNDPAKTVRLANGKPAVELSFRFELGFDSIHGEPILYSGHLDRLVEFNGDLWVLDRKTTGGTISGNSSYGYFAQFSPHNQMTGYQLAGKVVLGSPVTGVIIDAVQIAKTFSHFERGFTTRTDSQLDEWRMGARDHIMRMHRYAEDGFFPMNETACDKFGGCQFRGICSRAPEVREVFLKTDFVQQFWDPLETRGDI